MPRIDIKHPHAKRIVVFDEKGEQIKACVMVDTDAGVAECFEVMEMKHEDVIGEDGKVRVEGAPYFMTKKDDKGLPIRKKLFGKFTLKWRGDEGITDIPAGVVL
jgi:hypothetical protein